MNLRQDWHSGFVLHARAFRETSLLLEIFSADHGRIAAVARGAKRGKAKDSSLLQPFIPLHISWYGNGDLVTLTGVELAKPVLALRGRSAICGLYTNELVIKLVPKWDHCVDLFAAYESAITNLAIGAVSEQVVLRKFEMQLLKSLGYGLQLIKDVATGAAVNPDHYYLFDPVLGPRQISSKYEAAIKGASLLALAAGDFNDTVCHDAAVLLDLKRLMRLVLRHHLGNRQIISRELL